MPNLRGVIWTFFFEKNTNPCNMYIDGQAAQGRYEHTLRPDMITAANVLGRGVPAHGLSTWPKHDTINRAMPT